MKTLHLVCNSHIDPVWMWDWDEGASAALATFYSAAELEDEYDFIFCHNESILYEYIEKYDKVLFDKIKTLVKQGKWKIMGGWYLQPDCLTPSGESYIRQITLGKQYFTKTFGDDIVFPTTALNFDSFGHDRGLVQILSKCGYDSYICCRPMPSILELPANPFLWEGYDGSQIKTLRVEDMTIYCSGLGTAKNDILRKAEQFANDDVGCILWGVGNHGGGPSRKDLSDIMELMDEKKGEYRIIHSTLEQYFAEIEPKTSFNKSLIPCFPKSISSISKIKQKHAEIENKLFSIEKACASSFMNGNYEYDENAKKAFKDAEKALCAIEFHDVLSGTCTKEGEISSIRRVDAALESLHGEFLKAYFGEASKFKRAKEGDNPFIIYNFQPYEREEIVETEILIPDALVSDTECYELHLYQDEKEIPCQTIKERSNINYDRRKRVAYKPLLAPLGVTRVDLRYEKKPKSRHFVNESGDEVIYSDEYKTLVFSKKNGLLTSYRANGKEYLSGGAFLPVAFLDNEDPWGWHMKEVGKDLTKFKPIKKGRGPFDGLTNFNIVEHGPILDEIECLFEYGASFAKVDYKIYHHTPYIDVKVALYWNEQSKGVKLLIPTLSGDYFAQLAYGCETFKPNGEENPSHHFVGVGKEDCLAIYTENSYGSSKKGKNLYMTLINGSAYCAHPVDDRPLVDKSRYIDYIEQGMHEFNFRMGVNKRNQCESKADEFLVKPYSLNMYPHGDGKISQSQIALDSASIVLSSMRLSEEGGVILRFFNNSPKKEECDAKIFGINAQIELNAYEFATFLYKDGYISEADASIY